jgi:pyruvate dehydrogenase E2 component (dihydrolipoamide acetyltransferase)
VASNVLLPQWGMGMQEGTVVEWLKSEGDSVSEDEPIVEIESEKTTDTVRAPSSGVLARILAPAGRTVRIYELLAVIAEPGEAVPDDEQPDSTGPSRMPPRSANQDQSPAEPEDKGPHRQVEPRARRVARDRGVDIALVEGTGPGGRVTEADVLRMLDDSSGVRTLRLAGTRAVTARRMADAAHQMALVTLTTEVDATELKAFQALQKNQSGAAYTDLVVKAVAIGLIDHPTLNAHLNQDVLSIWENAHIGVAVAIDDGLMVPVIRDAGSKTIGAIAEERRQLTERVQSGRATLPDITGSTFTVTNLGMYGIGAFTPIVNPPEVAILGIGRVDERAVRRDGQVDWRQFMALSLTFDHRAVDGAPAARFLRAVGEVLEQPDRLVEAG